MYLNVATFRAVYFSGLHQSGGEVSLSDPNLYAAPEGVRRRLDVDHEAHH